MIAPWVGLKVYLAASALRAFGVQLHATVT